MIRQLAFAVFFTFACATALGQNVFPRYEDFENCAPAPKPCGPDQKFCGAAGVSFTNGEALQGAGTVNPTVFIGNFCHDSCPSCGGLQFLFFRGLIPSAKRVSFDLWNESTVPFFQTISYTSSFIPPRFGTMMTVLLPPKVVTRVHLPPDQVVGGVLIWGGGAVDNLEWDEIVPAPATSIDFALSDNTVEEERRVLINRWRDDDLSGAYQTGYWSKDQTANGNVVIRATVKQNGAPVANKPVYFRVADPPDTAPYTNAFGDALNNDNHDKSGGTVFPNPAFTDSTGNVTTTLTVTTFAAGDNYRIEASLDEKLKSDPAFACNASTLCFKSGVMTAWKRMYYEFDHMFRKGTFLRESATAGKDRVRVKKNTDLWKPGVAVRLLHAPTLQLQTATNPVLGTKPQFFYTEDHIIKEVVPDKNGDVWLVFTQKLSGSYWGEDQAQPVNGVAPKHLLDAIGVITDPNNPDADFYRSTFGSKGVDGSTPVDKFFADAFVDLKEAPQSFPDLPYIEATAQAVSSVFDEFKFADRWFHESIRSATASPKSRPNHLHLLSATVYQTGNDLTLGVTRTDHGSNFSYLFRGRMEKETAGGIFTATSPLTGLPLPLVLLENAAHEIAHQWHVNAGKFGEHCTELEWNHPTRFCRMHDAWDEIENFAYKPNPHNVERGDGIMAFHYRKNGNQTDSEYLTIRRSPDPLP